MRLEGEAASPIYEWQLTCPKAGMPFPPSCLMQVYSRTLF